MSIDFKAPPPAPAVRTRNVLLQALLLGLLAFGIPAPASAAFGAKFEPPDGRSYSGAGQHVVAGAALANASLPGNMPRIFADYDFLDKSLGHRAFYGAEKEFHNFFPGAMVQIGLGLPLKDGAELAQVGAGAYDSLIRVMARHYRAMPHPVFLRIGYECDGPWNGYPAAAYVSAFRRIVSLLREEKAGNVAMLWNLAGPSAAMEYYPGDDYVDWWSFNFWNSADASGFLAAAARHKKPVMVGESSKQGKHAFKDFAPGYFRTLNTEGIKGFQYIHEWWNTMVWDWDDARFLADTARGGEAPALWRAEMARPRYLHRDESAYNPMALYVHASRALLPGDGQGAAWRAAFDESTAQPGFGYAVSNAVHHYDAWNCSWRAAPGKDTLVLRFRAPRDTALYLSLRLARALAVRIGPPGSPAGESALWARPAAGEFKALIPPGGRRGDSIEVRVIGGMAAGRAVRAEVMEMGLQKVSRSAPVLAGPPRLQVQEGRPDLAFAAPATGSGHRRNIYRNGNLIAVTEGASFADPRGAPGDRYAVSAWDSLAGEGPWLEASGSTGLRPAGAPSAVQTGAKRLSAGKGPAAGRILFSGKDAQGRRFRPF